MQNQSATINTLGHQLKAVADPLRLTVLALLGQSSFGVLELAELLDTKQSGMSHHLKKLANGGWVVTRREGNSIFYRRRLPHRQEADHRLRQEIFTQLDDQPLPHTVAARLQQIQAQRASRSRDFFARYADLFAERQDLIAEHHLYDGPAAEMLRRAHPAKGGNALEVGPGEGHFLLALADQFDEVLGLDSEAGLIQQARQLVQSQGKSNVQLQQAEWPLAIDPHWDLVAFNMVLHHLPAPATALKAAANVLNPGGTLLVTELCRHDQAWARERCGDLWQGFDESELTDWTQRAGLVPLETQFLALKNGFQIQVASYRQPDTITTATGHSS